MHHGGDESSSSGGFRYRRNRPQLYNNNTDQHQVAADHNSDSQPRPVYNSTSLLGVPYSSPNLTPQQKQAPPSTNQQTSSTFGFAGWTSAVTGIAANLLDPKKDDNIVNPNSINYQSPDQYNQSTASSFSVDFGGFFGSSNRSPSPLSAFNREDPTSSTFASPTDVYEMPCRERTNEFMTTVKSIQMRQSANGFAQKPQKKVVTDALQFNQMAKRIGRDLSNTCAKLEKLAILGKKTSLFNDRMAEMEDLTAQVKFDITHLNKQIANLQQFVTSRHLGALNGAVGAGAGAGGRNNQTGQHSRSVVVGLQSKLASVSQDFKTVLEERTETLKQQKSRRDKFSQSTPVPSSLPHSMSAGNMGSVLLAEEQDGASSSVALDMGDLEKSRMQQQVQLIDEQESYVQSRANTMENIESSIVELGTIFRQLATLVQEQGETVQRIDSNVEETGLNIEAAHGELLKYFQNISKNRWLMIKIFGVLFVFFIVFVVFLT